MSFYGRNLSHDVGESEHILSMKRYLTLADVERFKRNVKGENESEKHPYHWIDSAYGMT
jgi:hypothetical protein